MRYDQDRELIEVVLKDWRMGQQMEIQDNRHLLDRLSTLISARVEEFIHKAIENTWKDCTLGNIQLVDGNLGRRVSTDEQQVCPINSHSLSIYVRLRVLKE